MEKFLVLSLILLTASAVNAGVSFQDSSLTVVTDTTVTFNIISDDTAEYIRYVGNTPGLADLTGMSINANAGPDAYITENPSNNDGWWEIAAQDDDDAEWNILSGVHFTGSLDVGSSTGSYSLDLYLWDGELESLIGIDTLPITIIPEPMTILFLGLGGLLVHGRK